MATYYIRSTGGNDSNDGLSFANAWLTPQHAYNTASAAGDKLIFCGTFSPEATINIDLNAGTSKLPIESYGGNTTDGSIDGTIAVFSGASLPATSDLVNLNVVAGHLRFTNMRFTAATRYNITQPNTGLPTFVNCRIDNAASHGFYCTNSSTKPFFIDTEIDSNGADGLSVLSAARGRFTMNNCIIHDNAARGIYDGGNSSLQGAGPPTIEQCLIYNNGSHGVEHIGSTSYFHIVIKNSTIFGNTGDGIRFSAYLGRVIVSDCILRSNGGYGINTLSNTVAMFDRIANICSHNNASGHIDINSGTLPGSGHVLEDPDFVSETDGSEDLTPQNANLLITYPFAAGGSTYNYIGAIQPQPSTGGSGGGSIFGSSIIRKI